MAQIKLSWYCNVKFFNSLTYEKKSIGSRIGLSIGESIVGSTGKSNTNFVPNIGRSIGAKY